MFDIQNQSIGKPNRIILLNLIFQLFKYHLFYKVIAFIYKHNFPNSLNFRSPVKKKSKFRTSYVYMFEIFNWLILSSLYYFVAAENHSSSFRKNLVIRMDQPPRAREDYTRTFTKDDEKKDYKKLINIFV